MTSRFAFAAALLVLVMFGAWQWNWNTSSLETWMGAHPAMGAGAYVLLLVGSVVLIPFSSLPLLPLAARHYGVVGAALLSAGGWWLGCLVAFAIARVGRRHLERVTSLESVDRLAARVPPDVGFWGIVLLRMMLPVDVVSFALGLVKALTFRTYAVASLVGIVPFAFVWSYAGGELGAGRWLSAILVAAAAALLLILLRRRWLRRGHA